MASIVNQQDSGYFSFLHDSESIHQVLALNDFTFSVEEMAGQEQSLAATAVDEECDVALHLPHLTCVLKEEEPITHDAAVEECRPSSPEMFSLQHSSSWILTESPLSPHSRQSLSPNPVMPEPSASVQPDTPVPVLACPSQPLRQFPVEPVFSPCTVRQIEEEPLPTQFFGKASHSPKKRGRKRKYPEGFVPRRRRPRKTKIYEMQPLQDEELEKRRRNAVIAKQHRDKKKNELHTLLQQLKAVTDERDSLRKEAEELSQTLQQLMPGSGPQGLEAF